MFKDSPEWFRGTRDRFRGTLKWIRVTFQIVSGIPWSETNVHYSI